VGGRAHIRIVAEGPEGTIGPRVWQGAELVGRPATYTRVWYSFAGSEERT
jgi:hypothetical protein